jgi:hypothetical protein
MDLLRPKTLRGRLALTVAKRVCVHVKDKRTPGNGFGRVWVDENDYQVAIINQGEGFDLLIGPRSSVHQFSVSSALMARVALWILWWWMIFAWFGLRFRLWRWAVGVLYDDTKKETAGHETT